MVRLLRQQATTSHVMTGRQGNLRPALVKNFQLALFFVTSLALMMGGWGERSGFLHHPARAGVVVVLGIGVLVLFAVPFDFFARGTKEISRQRWGTYAALGLVGICCWFLPYADRRGLFVWPESDLLRYLGLVSLTLGTGIRVAGMAQLGALFSGFVVVHPEHRLLTTGCYRWVRHPIYAGSLLAVAGFFLVFRSQLVVVFLPLYTIGTLWRIADEERLLTERFGQAYEHYCARTWRLVPFFY
ncbi:MAG: isoprenylcysteine carboxylmethyltransferase family protein [Candidatus Binatia bacterium]|nr:isoprenylcysteine carboxylmethyltransferase family protein [Candidatus Binatia bacterium]